MLDVGVASSLCRPSVLGPQLREPPPKTEIDKSHTSGNCLHHINDVHCTCRTHMQSTVGLRGRVPAAPSAMSSDRIGSAIGLMGEYYSTFTLGGRNKNCGAMINAMITTANTSDLHVLSSMKSNIWV